jgi:hypothetical protein
MNEVNNPRTKINPTQCRTHINAITKMQTKTKQNQKKKNKEQKCIAGQIWPNHQHNQNKPNVN